MVRSKREIAFVKRLARYLAAALGAKLKWNWPERWSEWEEIDRVTVGEGRESIHFDEKYLDDDHQMKLMMRVPTRSTDVDATFSIGLNEKCGAAWADADHHIEYFSYPVLVGFEAILYGRKREEEEE